MIEPSDKDEGYEEEGAYKSYDEFFSYENEFETYRQEMTTPSGDEIVAFGYYGHD